MATRESRKYRSTASADCLAPQPATRDLLSHPEPGFFILGAKSYGSNPNFLIRTGLDQLLKNVFGRKGAADG